MSRQKSDWLWWKHGVLYQIYPRSFQDSNDDGIGDIPGIIARLDYLADLGVDGIWLSPVNTSPMFDFGYDISDYRGIDPLFGNLKDFDGLIREAHRRGIRIIMDLVINHTSHLHPWFLESRSSRDNPKRDWYVWHDGIDGKPPNNWMASFGGRAWEWDGATGQYYLHTFLKEQPDLNWRNPAVKKAVFGEIRFWLDRGVDGFRLDVVNWFVKDGKLRSNPFGIGPNAPRPYDLQKHIYDRNQPETHDIIKDFRKLLDRYRERMSVGEVYSEPPGNPALSAEYLGGGRELHLTFDFSLVFTEWDAAKIHARIDKWMGSIPPGGWPCHVLSNHDNPRALGRYAKGRETGARARVAAALLLTLKGTPFIYYGEEIGMRNGKIRRKEIVDPPGIKYWPLYKGRDPERTPMQWSADEYAGFSSVKPWLPVNADHREVNARRERRDPNSLLNFYRSLIALRKEKKSLHRGEWAPLEKGTHEMIAYYRTCENEKVLVILNFGKGAKIFRFGEGIWKVIFSTHRPVGDVYSRPEMELCPYEATLMERV